MDNGIWNVGGKERMLRRRWWSREKWPQKWGDVEGLRVYMYWKQCQLELVLDKLGEWGGRESEINKNSPLLLDFSPTLGPAHTDTSFFLLIPKIQLPWPTLQSSLFLLFPARLISSSSAWKMFSHPSKLWQHANCMYQLGCECSRINLINGLLFWLN